MLSMLKQFLNLFDYDFQKEEYAKKFEEETKRFEKGLEEEKSQEEERKQYDKNEDEGEDEGFGKKVTSKAIDSCTRRTGIITKLDHNNGFINDTVFFDSNGATSFRDLRVGCTVEYLVYQPLGSDHSKVVKVEMVKEGSWDEAPTDKEIQETIDSLKSTDLKYFNTHERSILGLIMLRKRQFITVDTDYKEITVDLDTVTITFIPKEGDRVYLICNVQTDENFVDLAGEILETKSIHPARSRKEQGTVKKLYDDWGVIDLDCYFTTDILDMGVKVNEGDIVSADMIECERGNYFWRCLTIEVLERAEIIQQTSDKKTELTKNNTIQAISITDEIRFVFQNAFETQKKEIEIKNNSERQQKIMRCDFAGQRRHSQLKLGENLSPVTLEPGQTTQITLHCESRFYGASKEKLIFTFPNFKISRNIEIAVGIDENKENIESTAHILRNRSRHYAHQVWSKKNEVIPGVRGFDQRHFVFNRIGSYEVPEKLRSALLTECSRGEQIRNVESLYPALTKEADIHNYSKRFQTLLFVEEIEQFVNFRQYDQERGHFTREGEYLALAIDNLAERRPSLVLGDIVRATNPWAEHSSCAFDGCIHKVLCNRILLKFNPNFHNSYNGEDYRLEFFFSRYGFRKQHYAVQKIVRERGDQFLFPSKMNLSEKTQLDASLDEDLNLMIGGKILPRQWCNPNLNVIQKQAIKNILRGEARLMPYIIFGPPGTGKTVTLVETILQLVINMPNSRILVGTPTNSAADLLTIRLIDSGVFKPGDLVRLLPQRLVDSDVVPEGIKQYCATVDIGIEGAAKSNMKVLDSGIQIKCQVKYLGRHKVTISTCSTLGNFHQMEFPKKHFTHVIIDESGQCTEPEIMVPISLLTANWGQVVLAGDPYQLGPIVVNNFAADRGLRTSYLERILSRLPYKRDKIRFPPTGFDPRLVTKLIYNYRALPSILNVYSNLFYDSELLAMLDDKVCREAKILEQVKKALPVAETRSPTHGVFFHGLRGENKQDMDSPSWYNPIEAKHIFMLTVTLYRLLITHDQIGIITPYQKQVKILRALFAEGNVVMPKIGTVEEFQGQERDIILVSTVRSSKDFVKLDLKFALGFTISPKRMNVAISRPRALLYVCGNPHLLSLADNWTDFIKDCVANDSYFGCDLPDKITAE